MARFTNGWVKVYRSAGEGDLVGNPILFALWFRLLIMATWKPTKILWGGKQRELPAGSVVFGVKEISETWDLSRSVVQKWLHYLHDTGRIVLTASPRGSVVTICNWEAYQTGESDDSPESVSSEVTASSLRGHSEALIEEVKKGRKKEEGYSPEFEAAWEAFGKIGKKKDASKAFGENVPAEKYPDLLKSIAAYLADCRSKERTQMYFGTYLREDWTIWLERKTVSGPKLKTLEEIEQEGLFSA